MMVVNVVMLRQSLPTCLNIIKIKGALVDYNVNGGGKGSMRPGRHCGGTAFGGPKIWNSQIWPLLANCRLHCSAAVLLTST